MNKTSNLAVKFKLPSRNICRTLKQAVEKRSQYKDHLRAPTSTQAHTCPFNHKLLTEEPSAFDIVGASQSYVKPFEEIPKAKGWPILGTLVDCLMHGGPSKYHTYCENRHKELGPIYTEMVGSEEVVFVADKDLIQTVYQNEGKYPVHMVPEPWVMYNEMTGNKRGLFFMDGEAWSRRRQNLNNIFLHLKIISEYAKDFNEIADDVVSCWKLNRDENKVLLHLEKELYKWSIESLGVMIFGRRMGCYVQKNKMNSGQFQVDPDEIQKFVNYVQEIFAESAKMSIIPPKLAKKFNLPVWKRFVKAVGSALEIAKGYVDESLQDIIEKLNTGEPVQGILSKLLMKDQEIDEEEIVRIVTDLFLAAADTTSHTTQWALYLLAKHPKAQEHLYQEIRSVVPENETVSHETIENIPYVKAVVKEALRLYPVAPFLTRIMTKDLFLSGYHIPKDKLVLMSIYTTSRDPKYFAEPNEFKPERWLRSLHKNKTLSTHACLPFGLGTRACIGRRVAEKQMHILLAKIVNTYHLEVANTKEVDIHLRMITTPSEPIKIKLEERVPGNPAHTP